MILPEALRFARFRLQMKVATRAPFPRDKGPLFRRGLIPALREASCGSCAWGPGPLPFVLLPPTDDRDWYFAGETWTAGLVLVGDAIGHVRCFLDGCALLLRRGLGPERARVLLEQADVLDPRDRKWTSYWFVKEGVAKSRVVPFAAEHLRERAALLAGRREISLRFATPLRMSGADALPQALVDRLYALTGDSGDSGDSGGPAAGMEVADEMAWTPRPCRTPEGRGTLRLRGDLDPWFAALVAGQHLGVGDGAPTGFGHYELAP
ncbi:MAG: hypothetical protein FJX76_08780 [Armatimonadetes bacterium]|nr:hypothetical protein [Armatimonadota bacterium]